jgi:hypothetical protein
MKHNSFIEFYVYHKLTIFEEEIQIIIKIIS